MATEKATTTTTIITTTSCQSCGSDEVLTTYNTLTYCSDCLHRTIDLLESYAKLAAKSQVYQAPTHVFDNIYIGRICSVHVERLRAIGIERIVVCGSKLKNENHDSFDHIVLPLDDSLGQEDILCVVPTAMEYIKNSGGKKVMIHCHAGISRSGSILTAYVMHTFNLDYENAIQYVRERYSRAFPNSNFQAQLRSLGKPSFAGPTAGVAATTTVTSSTARTGTAPTSCIVCGGSNVVTVYNEMPVCQPCFTRNVTMLEQYDEEAAKNRVYQAPTHVFDNIYIGNICSVHVERLRAIGIERIVVCGSKLKNENHDSFDHIVLPLDDSLEQDILCVVPTAMEYIKNSGGKKVMIHCHAGISRSGSILTAYVMHTFNLDYENAIQYVKERYSRAFPNSNFQAQLRCLGKPSFTGATVSVGTATATTAATTAIIGSGAGAVQS